MTHTITIVGVSRPRAGYRAQCRCGWHGRVVRYETATANAAKHYDAAAVLGTGSAR